jgi:glutathione synthase/RimK-type ligase-like ATP-grasp enzyme
MSEHLVVLQKPSDWPAHFPSVPLVGAKEYLTGGAYAEKARLRIINLCRSWRYGSLGYYCSLLAEARGHRVIPTVRTIQDLSRRSLYSLMIRELDEMVQAAVASRRLPTDTDRLRMMVHLGRSSIPELQELAQQIFESFRAPLLRVDFRCKGDWRIADIRPLSLKSLDAAQSDTFVDALKGYMSKPWRRPKARPEFRYDLAVLHDPEEPLPPSDGAALGRFIAAARELGMDAELIQKRDYGRIAMYDALFIRVTTAIDHHSFRFSHRAQREGLVVIDDPDSILRCTNKVFLEELLRAHRIPRPRTLILAEGEERRLKETLAYPIILKIPDGSFSRGVFKADDRGELRAICRQLFKDSDLILAQEYMYTTFDWRVGVLDRTPLFVCKYLMSAGHWQIYDHDGSNGGEGGEFETLAVEAAPAQVVKTALRAANLIGDGLYGVDLKETPDGVYVIEVNDNPSIDADVEDKVLGAQLYRQIMRSFRQRLDRQRTG